MLVGESEDDIRGQKVCPVCDIISGKWYNTVYAGSPSAARYIRPLSKLHLPAEIAFFGIFTVKFFDHVFTHALKILRQICTKIANFIKQSEFRKRSIGRRIRQSTCSYFDPITKQDVGMKSNHLLTQEYCKMLPSPQNWNAPAGSLFECNLRYFLVLFDFENFITGANLSNGVTNHLRTKMRSQNSNLGITQIVQSNLIPTPIFSSMGCDGITSLRKAFLYLQKRFGLPFGKDKFQRNCSLHGMYSRKNFTFKQLKTEQRFLLPSLKEGVSAPSI